MLHLLKVVLLILCFCLALPFAPQAEGKVNTAKYAVAIPAAGRAEMLTSMDSVLKKHPSLLARTTIVAITSTHGSKDHTGDFYLLLSMVLFLGGIRYTNPRYFSSLWRTFLNPTLNGRQLKDQLEFASFQGFLMNVFFAISCGAYVYYVVRLFLPGASNHINPLLLLLLFMAGMGGIYLAKYLLMRFSGWAFRVEGITDNYIFNVFLINKVMAVLLVPFSLLLAFAEPMLSGPALIVSFILIGLLLINRYTRSWHVFGSFFQFSRFHFFTYFCASELLPLALLMKLLVRGLNI